MHVRLPGDPHLPRPLGRFRVPGVGDQKATTPPARTSLVRQLCPPPRSRNRIGSEQRAKRPSTILAPWAVPDAPDFAGARIGSQRVQPPSDVARPTQILPAGQ